MLILVAVTISMAVNGGLFEYAGKATGETKNAMQEEGQLGNGGVTIDGTYYNSIDEYLETKKGNEETVKLPEGLKVGDYVNYTPTAGTYKVAGGANGSGYRSEQSFTTETGDAALKWRVLSIDEENGSVELVAATQSSKSIYFTGADGYNHAVDILNDMCKELYSNENGATARSIKIEDINAKTTYDYTTYNSGKYTYNDTIQLSTYGTSYMKYPNLYSQEIGYGTTNTFNTTGLSISDGKKDGVTDENGVTTYSTVTGDTDGNTAGTDPYITYTYYNYKAENYLNTNLGINTAPTGLLNTGEFYWLASRSVLFDGSYAYFNVCAFNCWGGLSYYDLFSSDGYGGKSCGNVVRPVVSLGSNVTLTKDLANSTEEVVYWNIEY